jgi:hypothetical protein
VLEAVADGADVERVVGTRSGEFGWGELRERYGKSL